jgi:hypothetical protein
MLKMAEKGVLDEFRSVPKQVSIEKKKIYLNHYYYKQNLSILN